MDGRETREIKTTSGKVAVVYTYITGGESNMLKQVLMEGVTVDSDKNVSRVPLVNGLAREAKLIGLAVLSFDGETNAVVEKVQDLPSTEYDAFIKELTEDLKLNFTKAT